MLTGEILSRGDEEGILEEIMEAELSASSSGEGVVSESEEPTAAGLCDGRGEL